MVKLWTESPSSTPRRLSLFGLRFAGGWDYCGPLFDGGNHAGYNGWTIQELLSVAKGAVAVHKPDIVTLMAGTNDFFFEGDPSDPTKGANVSQALNRMKLLL